MDNFSIRDVVGLSESKASKILSDAGFSVRISNDSAMFTMSKALGEVMHTRANLTLDDKNKVINVEIY